MDCYYQEIDDDNVPPSKRPRILNDATPTTTPMLFPAPTDPQSIGRNASMSAMFFKTRLCQGLISAGFCPYGDRCTFAHSVAELRPPAPNWQGTTAAPQCPPNATKICRMFQSRGACSYGERCTFRHVAEAETVYAGPFHHHHGNGPPIRGPAPAPLHRKPCFEWLSKGRCLYGDRCIFSHEPAVAVAVAVAGTQKSGDGVELNSSSGGVAPPPPSRPIREAADEPEIEFQFEAEAEAEPVSVRPVQGRGFQKMLRKKKIAGIYGDSFDEE